MRTSPPSVGWLKGVEHGRCRARHEPAVARPDHRDLEALGTAEGSPRRPGLTAQREALAGLGVNADRVYVAIAGELTARG